MVEDIMSIIHQAGSEQRILNITYKAKDGKVTHRTVEPYEVKNGGLYAYDINKHGIRNFTLQNIVAADVADTIFSPRFPILV